MLSASTFQKYVFFSNGIETYKYIEKTLIWFLQAPVAESFKRPQNQIDPTAANHRRSQGPDDMEATFLTTDTSFVENPPSSKISSKFQNPQTPAPASKTAGASRGRGGIPRAGGRAGGIPTRGGIARGTRGASGIARGTGRGRGSRGTS